jgi:hypothetical protein
MWLIRIVSPHGATGRARPIGVINVAAADRSQIGPPSSLASPWARLWPGLPTGPRASPKLQAPWHRALDERPGWRGHRQPRRGARFEFFSDFSDFFQNFCPRMVDGAANSDRDFGRTALETARPRSSSALAPLTSRTGALEGPRCAMLPSLALAGNTLAAIRFHSRVLTHTDNP